MQVNNSKTKARVLVVQPTARRHYAVPAALHAAGMLERMDTELFIRSNTLANALAQVGKKSGLTGLRRIAGMSHPGLRDANVRISLDLTWRHLKRQLSFSNRAVGLKWYMPQASKKTLRRGFGRATALYGFVRVIDPALCREARKRNLRVIGDQSIAPSLIQVRELRAQLERFPGWEPNLSVEGIEQYQELEHATWAHCDAITCMSEWVREGLIQEGLPSEKLWLLPYPSGHTRLHEIKRQTDRATITIGFVGSIGLRKGAPYFFEVAKRLASKRVRFVMVGPILLDNQVINHNKGTVEVIGPVPRIDVGHWLERFDIFYFPSTCEGSAGAVNEAMASALPVVTTPNSGSTVRDGKEGFLIAPDDVATACERIEELVHDAELRCSLGGAGRIRNKTFDLSWYSKALARHILGMGNLSAPGKTNRDE